MRKGPRSSASQTPARLASFEKKPASGGTPASASVPTTKTTPVCGILRKRPPIRKMSLVPTAWITAPAARKRSALNTPWVKRCRTLASAAPAPAAVIKRVLAYSTVSQLGYMMAAAGAGAADASVLHLVTHGVFKALLFLAAGAVIHAVGTNDIFRMGGLFRRMPQ